MDIDIAKGLGEILAFQTEALDRDPYDEDALSRTLLISQIYANFVGNGFERFKQEFEVGYQIGQREGRLGRGAESGLAEDEPVSGVPPCRQP